jgi:hypothetical protein
MKITSEMAVKMIRASKGKILSVRYRKKDGTMRDMVCRTEVKKGVKGTGMAYDPVEHDLMTVYDVQAEGWRMINLDEIQTLKMNGKEYKVV